MGGIPNPESKTVAKYGLSYIRPRHMEIARRLICGQNQKQICEALGMTEPRMSIIVNSPLFKITLKRLEDERNAGAVDIAKDLREVSPVALDVLERTMLTAKSETLRHSAAKDILDRAGWGALNKSMVHIKGDFTHSQKGQMTDEELRSMISERIKKAEERRKQKEKEEADAEAIEVDYDEVDECSTTEQDAPKVLLT